jgi:L-ascorbate metabolism protein UlaG (beta-lactamase superfamily)
MIDNIEFLGHAAFRIRSARTIYFDPTYAIPMHYGSIVGSDSDAQKFVELVGSRGVIIPPQQ